MKHYVLLPYTSVMQSMIDEAIQTSDDTVRIVEKTTGEKMVILKYSTRFPNSLDIDTNPLMTKEELLSEILSSAYKQD